MCTIDKLLIKGIRSFSPDNQNIIEFYRPLTLIVGHNGAGKTTIIECLKQACTGELPPNTRSGQSFVHDPKVAGESEVKAQIKLRFRTVDGAPVVVVRSFQLTQKKTALQFKALDQTLQMVNRVTGEKAASNHRCQELDKIVPSLMGVSKAVLENVIFVHQEDSNWPLGEGQILKKKFDDIFAATKYTKALEALRKLRTEKVQEVKEMKLKLDHLSTHKDSAHRLQTERQDGEARERAIAVEMDQLTAKIEELQEGRTPLAEKLDHLLDLIGEENKLTTQLSEAASHMGPLEARLREEVTEDDLAMTVEEVQQFLRDQDPQQASMQSELVRLQQAVATSTAGLGDVKGRYARAVEERGRLNAEAERYKRTSKERDDRIREACSSLELSTSLPQGGALTADQVMRFETDLKQGLRAARAKLEAVQAAGREREAEAGQAAEAASSAVTTATEAVQSKKRQLQRSEEQLSSLRRNALAVSEELLEDAEALVATCQAELQARDQQWAAQSFPQRLEEVTHQLATLQRKAVALRQERDRMTTAAENRTRARMKQQELRQKEGQIKALLASRKEQLAALLGCAATGLPPPAQLKAAVQAAVQRKEGAVGTLTAKQREARDRAAQVEGQLQAARAARESLQNQANALRADIEHGMQAALGEAKPATELDHSLAAWEKEKDVKSNAMSRIKSLSLCYGQYVSIATSENKCMTCNRPFANDRERDEFFEKQEFEKQRFPEEETTLQQQIASLSSKLDRLKLLQPKQLRLNALEGTEVRQATERVKALEKQLSQQESLVAQLSASHTAAEQDLQDARSLAQDVAWEVDRHAGEAAALRADLETLGVSSQTLGLESGRDLEAVDADLDSLEAERSGLERERDMLQRKQDRLRTEKHEAEISLQQARAALQKMQMEAEAAQKHAERVAGLEQEVAQLQQDLCLVRDSLPALEEKRARLFQQREARREAAWAEEKVAKEVLQRWEDCERELLRYSNELKQYNDCKMAEQLERAVAEVQNLLSQQSALEAKIKKDQAQWAEKEQRIKEHGEFRRTLEMLLDFKQRSADREAKLQRISQIKAEMSEIGEQKKLTEDLSKSEAREQELRSKQDQLRGSLGTIREQVRRAKEELRNPNYRDIDGRYRKALICLRTTEMANSDLEKYHKAVELALLAFHTNKMADINQIVKELWQKTYRSQDIDYIQIKADAEGARSYNYRVVMMSGGAELDMRGRCSAGQKVLACLIIRLALAETFCLNCGILALDEPTTNLDTENSSALAEALRSVMEARRAQSNFQLIVITHDERFAQLIGTREHAEYMWRVTKDANQHSTVVKQDIAS